MDEDEAQKAFEKAVSLLNRRGHSSAELARKLNDRSFSPAAVEFAVSECARLNFINDELFAENYIYELKAKGAGPFKIKRALSQRGISSEISSRILKEQDSPEEEYERAKEAFDAKLRTLNSEKDPRKKKEKLFRFMSSRGYSGMVISRLLSSLSKNE